MSRKRGKLSLTEMQLIRDNIHELDIEVIAGMINRTVDPVKKYVEEHGLQSQLTFDDSQIIALKRLLRIRPYWAEVKKQLDKSETLYFEENWVALMIQFNENVQYSEEIMMKQWIILDILMNRSMQGRKKHIDEVDRLQAELDKELSATNRDQQRIQNLGQQLDFARGAIQSFSVEHNKLQEQSKAIADKLKASRDQRIKLIDDGKTTWTSFLRMLEDEKVRKRMGEQAEIKRIAADKARDKMNELHSYIDGEIDYPLLNSSTMKKEQENYDADIKKRRADEQAKEST